MSKKDEYNPIAPKEAVKLMYDISAIPKGLPVADMVKIFQDQHVVFWDSEKGSKPKFYTVDPNQPLPTLVDTKGVDVDIDFYTKEIREQEFWDRELHNCRMSPVYFWSNYGTSVWPHKDEDMRKYLVSHGIGQITAKDSEEAEKLWTKQKAAMKKLTDTYTIDMLKERNGVISVIKSEYQERVVELESLVGSKVRLVDSNNVPLTDRKRAGNLVEKIRKVLPVHPSYSDKYRTPKGKWDNSMLFNTSYDVLLKIFYDVLKSKGWEPDQVDSPAK